MPTLLVVDDEPAFRLLACRILRAAGFTCREAESGLAALALLQADEQGLDGMVVDIRLPDLSGLDLVRLVRTLRPGTPTLFISGYAQPAFEEPHRQQLSYGFLAKPFTSEQLIAAIRQLLPAPQQV